MEYKIEILLNHDDDEMLTHPIFWCLLGRGTEDWHNCGHGWATSPENAWKQAYEHYTKEKER